MQTEASAPSLCAQIVFEGKQLVLQNLSYYCQGGGVYSEFQGKQLKMRN